jgi:hypothetical protein
MNELKTQWIGEKSWTYKTTFGAKAVLVFEGLYIFAILKVNDRFLLQSGKNVSRTPRRHHRAHFLSRNPSRA